MSVTKKEYLDEKVKLAYHYSEVNRFFRKVRGIVVKGDKVLLLALTKSARKFSLPGGGIDEGENLKEAVKREVFEETGARVQPVKLISKSFYTVPMTYEGKSFFSRRVEFFYICKFIKYEHVEHLGLEGEFDDKVRVVELDYDALSKTKLRPIVVKDIIAYINRSPAFKSNNKKVKKDSKSINKNVTKNTGKKSIALQHTKEIDLNIKPQKINPSKIFTEF